jgi:hypothetical protein
MLENTLDKILDNTIPLGYFHVCATYLNANIPRALGHITLCLKSYVQRQTPLHSPPKPQYTNT